MFDEADNQLGILPAGTDHAKLRDSMTAYLEKRILDDVLNQTEKDIYSVAWRIGLVSYVRTRAVIKKSEQRLQDTIRKEFDDLLSGLIAHLSAAQKELKNSRKV